MWERIRPYFKNPLTRAVYHALVPRRVRTERTWAVSNTTEQPAYWANFPVVRKTYQKRITGNPELDLFADQIRKRTTPFGRVLAFGDGYGMAATAAALREDTEEVIYFNLSQGEGNRFIDLFASKSFPFPYQFVKGDANRFEFTSLGSFDTIIDVGAFHHFEKFERIFPQLNRILKTDGLLYADEFVGPSKFLYDQSILHQINIWLAALPSELILDRKPVTGKDYFRLWKRGSDRSESIRSGELDSWLRKSFTVIKANPFNGTWLHPFFLTPDLPPPRLNITAWLDSEQGRTALEQIATLEDEKIAAGELPPHFIFYVLGKKP